MTNGAKGKFAKSAPSTKPRLAIVSTFDDLCGIAGYTRFLIKQLENDFEIEVFDLDQFFMRGKGRHLRKIGDKIIKDFCSEFKKFDCVNIQLEHGTLGVGRHDIWRRFRWLARSAPSLSVTFHTVLASDPFDYSDFFNRLLRMRWRSAFKNLAEHITGSLLSERIYRLLRRLQITRRVNVIVHTRHDARVMRFVNRIKNVHDHPLSFLMPDQIEGFKKGGSPDKFPPWVKLNVDAYVIGVFGFIGEYKGFETAVRALFHLPDNYYLAFFGALHPNEVKRRQPINPYLLKIIDNALIDKTVWDPKIDRFGEYKDNIKNVHLSVDGDLAKLLHKHPNDLSKRILFMGEQTDEDFARAMSLCNVAVFPYMEVGQSSSGPISIALEMGIRIIASRTRAFKQFARYHDNTIEMFDIGNDVELAQRIATPPVYPTENRELKFDYRTNRLIYLKANSVS